MSRKRMNIVAIILARGGSKGIPQKNIINFCGQPLIQWTIDQLKKVEDIKSIWISSDSQEILTTCKQDGVQLIERPQEISGDNATSESAWLHAINEIENKNKIDLVIAPQVTSPLRESKDIKKGVKKFIEQDCDSMFSCCLVEDLFFWEKDDRDILNSINYDYRNRKRRQEISQKYIENGSFYIFKPEILRENNNRIGGKIGFAEMDLWKMFEIDSIDDLKICEALMRSFLLRK